MRPSPAGSQPDLGPHKALGARVDPVNAEGAEVKGTEGPRRTSVYSVQSGAEPLRDPVQLLRDVLT